MQSRQLTITTTFRVDISKAKVYLSRSEKVAAILESQLVSAIHLHQLYLYECREKARAKRKCKAYGYLGNERDLEGGLSQGRHSLWT